MIKEQWDSLDESGQKGEKALEQDARKLKEARETMVSFLNSEGAEEIVPLVREGEIHRAAIEAFQKENGWPTFTPGRPFIQPDDGEGALRVMVTSSAGSRILNIDLETAKIDWETFAATNLAPVAALLDMAAKANGVPFRCFLRASDYFNYGFGPEKWKCYQLFDPAEGDFVWGYVERYSRLDAKLESLLTAKGKRVPMVVIIKRPEGVATKQRQVRLVGLASSTWRIYEHSQISEFHGALQNAGPGVDTK